MAECGQVVPEWWLAADAPRSANAHLPSCLGLYFEHPAFAPGELQRWALRLAAGLNTMDPVSVTRILGTSLRRAAPGFAATTLFVRRSLARQARMLLDQLPRP